MFAEERQNRIYEIINRQNSVRVSELSQIFDTSEVTIRKDLDSLQKQNKIVRTHGGAVLAYNVGRAVTPAELLTKNIEAKQSIAKLAFSYINEYDTILMESSSTIYELCKLIAEDKHFQLRVITNSLVVANMLENAENCKVMVVGGEVNWNHRSIEGYSAAEFIRGIRVDKCFLGANGIDEGFGFSTPRYADAEIKTAMVNSSVESFVLSDCSKLEKVYLAQFATPTYLITDRQSAGFDYSKIDPDLTVEYADEGHEELESVGGKG